MRAILLVVLALLTATHIVFFALLWPQSHIFPKSLFPKPGSADLTQLALGFAVTMGIICIWKLARGGRFYLTAYVIKIGVLGFLALNYLPTGRLLVLSPSLAGLIGACVAVAVGWDLHSNPRKIVDENGVEKSTQTSWLIFFLITLNFFVALAPLSDMVPTGIQENGSWSPSSFQLAQKDSVGIKDNLIFVAVRSLIAPLVGNSILVNPFVSMILCAFGVAFLSKGIETLVGKTAALLAMMFITTEGWVLTGAYSANLTVTLIANAGLLFYILTKALYNEENPSRSQTSILMGMTLASCLLSLYSYAAVRIPWVFSIVVLGGVHFLIARGSILTKCSAPLTRVVLPITVALALVGAVGYQGDFRALKKDLLVSWPKDSVVSHPASGQLKEFVLIHNPDTPIWKQVARPSNGDNKSVIWTRTPSEMFHALGDHVGQILRENPRFFFISPLVFLLSLAALFKLPLMDGRYRMATIAICLWGIIWITSFLSVPDPVAYRRGIAFSAMAPILAALAFAPRSSARGLVVTVSALLGMMCAAMRLPDQLSFSNEPDTRSRMFTVCGNAFAVRTLLKRASVSNFSSKLTQVVLAGTENPRDANCLTNATRSNEWRRIFPRSSFMGNGDTISAAEALTIPKPHALLIYCSPDSMRAPMVGAICNETLPSTRIIETIPVIYGGVSDKWIVFMNDSDGK